MSHSSLHEGAINPEAYENLDITGPISVKAIRSDDSRPTPSGLFIILLLGPTGSGKSSFVESIANDKTLGIAKDQLGGVTQSLTIYRLKNVAYRYTNRSGITDIVPLMIIDTPGFGDIKFPESKTVRLILDFLRTRNLVVTRIFYFHRINDTRMAGSKGKLLDLINEMTGQKTGRSIIFVTTMWDRLWREDQLKKANERQEQMKNVHCKGFVDDNARVIKFENTQASALNILNQRNIPSDHISFFSFERVARGNVKMEDASFSKSLHMNLAERRDAILQNLMWLESELQDESVDRNAKHRAFFQQAKEETIADLAVVEEELKRFPPLEAAKTMNPDATARVRSLISPEPPRSSSAPPLQKNKFQAFVDRGKTGVKNLFHRRK